VGRRGAGRAVVYQPDTYVILAGLLVLHFLLTYALLRAFG